MRKSHLDLLALAARLFESVRIGQRTDMITNILVDIACKFAHDRGRAFWLQQAACTVTLVCPVVDDVALIDIAGAGELCTTRANIDIAFLVESKVGARKSSVGTR